MCLKVLRFACKILQNILNVTEYSFITVHFQEKGEKFSCWRNALSVLVITFTFSWRLVKGQLPQCKKVKKG